MVGFINSENTGLILDPFYSYIKLLIYLGMRLVIGGGCTFGYSTTKSSTPLVLDKPLSGYCLHKLNACKWLLQQYKLGHKEVIYSKLY